MKVIPTTFNAKNTAVVQAVDVEYLDRLFGFPNMVPVAAEVLARVPLDHLRYWCHMRAIYQVPSCELIGFLQHQIENPQEALEIGAGADGIGRSVGNSQDGQ